MLTMYKVHQPKADTERPYVKRKEGGRGLVRYKMRQHIRIAEMNNIAEYLNTKYKEDQF
jgi:hypothetical protein